jgi:2-iminobutanoate/2-iminopropanoate deaminase
MIRLSIATCAIAAIALSGCAAIAPSPPPTPACFHDNEVIEKDIGFCQALRSGKTLHISGVPGAGNMDAAVRNVYRRLDKVLAARGLKFKDVVKETVYTTDLDAFIKAKDIRKQFYGDALPAATWVQVHRLYLPQFVVEIELTAQFPE